MCAINGCNPSALVGTNRASKWLWTYLWALRLVPALGLGLGLAGALTQSEVIRR